MPEYHGCMVSAPVSADPVPRKRVLLAAPRGYCAGVDRAVQTVENALERFGAPVYVRKEIVHNKHVVQTLEERGAIFVEENEEVPEGSLVIFSAHGVAPDVHEGAARRNLRTIDATCPLVTKVHKEAVRFADEGYDILLIGHEGHEEVIGTTGEAPEHIKLVDGVDGVDGVEVRDPAKVAWLSQTTLSVDETQQTVAKLKSGSRCCSTRRRTTSATRRRTGRSRSSRSPGTATCCWWSARRTPRTRCAWSRSRSRSGCPPRTWWTSPTRWTRPGSRA
jgi:(E)-4-hydroxy-3-methyl-but-2-enyl pyrophosphate reductase